MLQKYSNPSSYIAAAKHAATKKAHPLLKATVVNKILALGTVSLRLGVLYKKIFKKHFLSNMSIIIKNT